MLLILLFFCSCVFSLEKERYGGPPVEEETETTTETGATEPAGETGASGATGETGTTEAPPL